jgi:uncharacterized protein (TIGR03118 family)
MRTVAKSVVTIATLSLAATVAAKQPTFERVDLVSDGAVPAAHVDPNLKNPWGLAAAPTGPWWVADNATNKSTLYIADGTPLPLVVDVPNAPTGLVFNGGNAFIVSDGAGHSGPARFIFAGEDGTIRAWSPMVPPPVPPALFSTQTFEVYSGVDEGVVYKGLAIATNSAGRTRLYATDFHNGEVEVFDDTFTELDIEGDFEDPKLPAGYAPFGIQALNGSIFVTYAKQDEDAEDDVAGQGFGFVDQYDLDGNFIRRVAQHGQLNAPWGLAIAPASWGKFAGHLLVGNFGDGTINAFKPTPQGDYNFAGTLRDASHKPIVIDGLWAIAPGGGGPMAHGSSDDLYFTAGINDEADGLFGLIRVQ